MKLKSIEVSNFKAIKRAKLDLHPNFNVLVGSNGSGKSSVLQALHWVLQSGRNQVVTPGKEEKASTLSEKDAVFMPSPDYLSAGHGTDYGNFKSNPQLDLHVCAIDDLGVEYEADMSLKAARNEGVSVHVPAKNDFVAFVRDRKREISAYIPGLAGIPLVEEKRSRLIVHRSAAAGDANTVLRNMLDLLGKENIGDENGLSYVAKLVARVMGDFDLRVEFEEARHTRVKATFRVGEMGATGHKAFKPLELAGIGYLQVLQIFCYLVYFRPALLLVDEPDAHLYPVAQSRLIEVLAEVAAEFDSQVILTTHSPSIMRSLPQDSSVIWMKDGKVEGSESSVRQLMGWGLLDRKIVLLTEDSQTEMLNSLLSQWPELKRSTAIWPFHGTGKLPTPETLSGFQDMVGPHVKLVIHRDRDFMMPAEVDKFAKPYRDAGHTVWVTQYSDIESYWGNTSAISAHFGVSNERSAELIEGAMSLVGDKDALMASVRKKRNDAISKINRDGTMVHYGDAQVLEEVSRDGAQYAVTGKLVVKKIRELAVMDKLTGANTFGKAVPRMINRSLADDLRVTLEACLS